LQSAQAQEKSSRYSQQFVISTGAQRSGETCSCLFPQLICEFLFAAKPETVLLLATYCQRDHAAVSLYGDTTRLAHAILNVFRSENPPLKVATLPHSCYSKKGSSLYGLRP